MTYTIIENAKVCASMLMEAMLDFGLESKVAQAFPTLKQPLTDLTLAWMTAALDYAMSGEGRIEKAHWEFINEALGTGFSPIDLDAASSARTGQPFKPDVVPAFLLLSDAVQPGAAEKLCLPIAGLLQCACAWDGKRTLDEIARIQDICEPIERRFGMLMPSVTPVDNDFWSNDDESDEDNAARDDCDDDNDTHGARPPPTAPRCKPGDALKELDALVGLASVKHEVRNIANLAKYIQHRKAAGLPSPDFSLHMVFTGNPGTGKTTVARLIAEIYRDVGIIESGQLVEVDREGLVAKYTGQTAPKTREVFMRAKGGVLFIDEAYTLVAGGAEHDSFGAEAIGTLLKLMEDYRDDVVVIVAGYSDQMDRFIASNPGLQSRFSRVLEFPDYEKADLVEIFRRMVESNQLRLAADTESAIEQAAANLVATKSSAFGNARAVRTWFEQALQNQANRLSGVSDPSRTQLQELLAEDIRCT